MMELGRNSGTAEWLFLGTSNQFTDLNPSACQYDADGQTVGPCDNGAPKLSFDGNNTSGTLLSGPGGVYGWHFFHGPALDDPLMGYFRPSSGSPRLFYWVTDGQGRQFTVADSMGSRSVNDEDGQTGAYRYAGGTNASNSFDADRFSSSTAPKLSFFRNRSYDQGSGRWTQEDPIGLGGGLNLYQFNGNNPVSFRDPFGLKVCYKGNSGEVDELRRGSEQATGSRITLDDDNCVSKVESNGQTGYRKIRARFQGQVDATETYTVQYDHSGSQFYSSYNEQSRSANILPGEAGNTNYNTGKWFAPCWLTGGTYDTPLTLGALIAHELIGHGGGGPVGEANAITWENQYHGAAHQPLRCGGN